MATARPERAAEPTMTTFRAIAFSIAAGLVLAGCANPAPSATPRQIDFRGTVTDAAGRFEADGFTCEVNAPANASLRLPPEVLALFTASCRKGPAPGQVQGTFLTLYGLTTDQSVAGMDIQSDALGSEPTSSSVVSGALADILSPDEAAAVGSAIGARGAADPTWMTVSANVSVRTRAAPLLFEIEVWGPAVTAFHEALVAGPSARP
jgi:hypothetical protein